MLDEIDAFHAAIFAHPADPLPRLAYADWLDDHGEAGYAELIRVWQAVNERPLPKRLRDATRLRRHELQRPLRDCWGLTELFDGAGVGFVNGVLPDTLSLTAAQLLRWEQWPPVLRPRQLEVRDYERLERAVAACPYLARVRRLDFFEPGQPLSSPPSPPESDPLLAALPRSPFLGGLELLRLTVRPSRHQLTLFAHSDLVSRLTAFEMDFTVDPIHHHDHTVRAEQPPTGAIRDAILGFVGEFAELLPQ